MALRMLCFMILFGLALILIFGMRSPYQLAGLQPLGTPSVEDLDHLARFDDHTAKPFFDARNQLQITVPKAMAAGDFLDLYLIAQPHVRAQIAEEEGWKSFQEDALLKEGKIYTIQLTPPDSGL